MSGAVMVKLLQDLCVHPDTAAGLLLSLPYASHPPPTDISHAVNGK